MYSDTRYKKIHVIALVLALALHGGIAAWALQPAADMVMQQQVIKISMVAPSATFEPKQVAEEKPLPPAKPKPDGLKAKKKTEKKHEPENEIAPKEITEMPQTLGPQAPEAVEKVAAHSDPVFNAAYLHNPAPVYPFQARKKGAQGKVLLEVQVTPEGTAKAVAVARSSGFSQLDEAALDAVRNWKFIPAKRGDEIVEAKVIVPVEFKLN